MTEKVKEAFVFIIYSQKLAVYCDSFGIDYIPQEVLSKTRDNSITLSIFRIQDDESTIVDFIVHFFHRAYTC